MTCPCWSIARYRYVQRPDDLHVRLIDEPPVTGSMAARPGSFDELGGEALHPPVDGDVINGDTALGQQFLDVTVRQAVPQVPADRDRDHLRREPEASEHRRSSQTTVTEPVSRPPRSTNATEPVKGRWAAQGRKKTGRSRVDHQRG